MQRQSKFDQLDGPFSASIKIDGLDYLYFGGTAYLGIPQHHGFIQYYLEGIKKFGLNNGTSRTNNVQLGIYNRAEEYAAQYFGAAAALITSSGYLAAQLVVKQLSNFGEVRYAPATHPALWADENPKVEGTFTDWASKLVDEINTSENNKWVIISNSMNNLFPEIYDFSFVQKIKKDKQLILIVDDSHGIGINNNGSGAYAAIQQSENIAAVVVASMAKALGVDAGLILAPLELINQLKQTEEFFGASPPSAAGLFAFMNAKDIYASALQTLQENMLLVSSNLSNNQNWHFIEGFPVFYSKNAELSHDLIQKQILVSSFPYPDKNGPIINRIVLSSWHDQNDILKLIQAL